MNEEVLANHERYLQRLNFFKEHGYDIQKERGFILGKALPLNGSILEAGTGKGHFAIALAQKGYHFTCVDVSEEEQKYARMNVEYFGLQDHIDFRIADAAHMDFDDGSFDNIFAVNMLHHLLEPYKVIDEFKRIVRLAGKIIISDFGRKGMDLVAKIHKGEGRDHPEGEATVGDIGIYLAKKGFTVDNFETEFQQTVIARWFDMERQ